jgi:hypothetical protein
MAPHPEHGGRESDQVTLPYRALADPEVIAEARSIYQRLQETNHWDSENDELLHKWRMICDEMNIRELTDSVTTSGGDAGYRNAGLEDSETRDE